MSDKTVCYNPSKLYEPIFDIETGSYIDSCPYVKYKRTPKQIYMCKCNSTSLFTNLTEYTNHIKTANHKKYLENYLFFNHELFELNNTLKEYRIDYELTHRKYMSVLEQLSRNDNNHKNIENKLQEDIANLENNLEISKVDVIDLNKRLEISKVYVVDLNKRLENNQLVVVDLTQRLEDTIENNKLEYALLNNKLKHYIKHNLELTTENELLYKVRVLPI